MNHYILKYLKKSLNFDFKNFKPRPLYFRTGISTVKMAAKFEILSLLKCKVCGEAAARHVHYGATTCFSCRAFFRRSIQNQSTKQYICRKGGNCSINLKTRKNCQKCRFDKCLSAGMKSSWVLSEDERFRR